VVARPHRAGAQQLPLPPSRRPQRLLQPGRHDARLRVPLPFADGSFTLAFLGSVFTHLLPPELERYLSEIARVLQPGGHCLISFFVLENGVLKRPEGKSSVLTFHIEGQGYRTSFEVPEQGVAYEESYIRGLYARLGLSIREPILWGVQDLIVAVKQPTGRACRLVARSASRYPAAMTARVPDVSVLIVNWKSGAMTRALIGNLRRQRFAGRDGGPGTLEFVVTDNASGPDEREPPRRAGAGAGRHAHPLRAERRLRDGHEPGGRAGARRLVPRQQPGRHGLPRRPRRAARPPAPQRQLRAGRAQGLPRRAALLPAPARRPAGLWRPGYETLARRCTTAGRRHAEGRTRRALAAGPRPHRCPRSQISGFCFLMPARWGASWGPSTRASPSISRTPTSATGSTARASRPTSCRVRRWSTSSTAARAGAGGGDVALPRLAALVLPQALRAAGRGALRSPRALDDGHGQGHLFAPVDALGVCESVPAIDVPGHGAYLAEISADQGFLFAAGRLDVSRRFQMPQAVWDGLVPAPYFVRFLDRPQPDDPAHGLADQARRLRADHRRDRRRGAGPRVTGAPRACRSWC
jgi:hypothetical protein